MPQVNQLGRNRTPPINRQIAKRLPEPTVTYRHASRHVPSHLRAKNSLEDGRRRGQQRMRWNHWLSGHEFEKTLGVGDEEGGLACCSPWCHKESDMTKQLNWTERQHTVKVRNNLQKKILRRLKDQKKKKKAAIIYTHKRQLPSREEYQSGQPFSSPGTEPESPTLTGGFFSIWATREAKGIHKTDVKYDYQKVIIRGEN